MEVDLGGLLDSLDPMFSQALGLWGRPLLLIWISGFVSEEKDKRFGKNHRVDLM